MKRSLVAIALLSTLAISVNSQAKPRDFMKALKQLDLSEEQLSKLKEHRKENKDREARKANRQEIKALKKEMNQAFIDGASDEVISNLHNQIIQRRSNKEVKRLEKMIFLKNLLTKEQRQKFIEIKKERRGKRGHHREESMD